MTPPRLGVATLASLPAQVLRPRYERAQLRTGIVHLGVGAFMRAHLAVATEAAMAQNDDLRWGLCGVSLRSPDTAQALDPQQGLYTVAVRDADASGAPRQRLQVVGALRECLVAPHDPPAVIHRIAAADTRIVSLTVTEKGYCRNPANGALLLQHPDIVADLASPHAPRSALGFIVRGLQARRAAGRGGLSLLSLDNLPANGPTLRALVLDLATHIDPTLTEWIARECSFPASMVDRIVPRTTPADGAAVSAALDCTDAWPVMAEPFFDWAVEDHFVAGRPDWTAVSQHPFVAGGAHFVADAAPWERLKLRMVNGAHSAIAYLGAMAGWPTVDEAMRQPALRRFIDLLLRDEVAPTLGALPGVDLDGYRALLLQRFSNPALAHRTQQIAMDGSQKVPQRWLGTVADRLAAGQPCLCLALAVAAWLHYLRGHDEAGHAYAVQDPLAEALAQAHADALRHPEALQQVRALLGFEPVFGPPQAWPAAWAEVFAPQVAAVLALLRERGVGAALAAWPSTLPLTPSRA